KTTTLCIRFRFFGSRRHTGADVATVSRDETIPSTSGVRVMSLKQQLDEYLAGWRERVPAERQAIVERHIGQLRGGIARTMLKVDNHAPKFALPDAKGDVIDFGTLLKKGPVVITFYRGGWCPYCNLELKAFQDVLPQIKGAGASVVAIS